MHYILNDHFISFFCYKQERFAWQCSFQTHKMASTLLFNTEFFMEISIRSFCRYFSFDVSILVLFFLHSFSFCFICYLLARLLPENLFRGFSLFFLANSVSNTNRQSSVYTCQYTKPIYESDCNTY